MSSDKSFPSRCASYVSYASGEPVPIGDSTDLEVRDRLAGLHDQHVRHSLVVRRSVPDLAVAAVRPVLGAFTGTPPNLNCTAPNRPLRTP
jgi:hypothetical protein